MIGTKLHQLREIVGTRENVPLLHDMLKAPKYFIDKDVVDLLSRNDVQTSIAAMIQANVARLPFNPLLIEYDTFGDTGGKMHCFVLLEEAAGCIRAQNFIMYESEKYNSTVARETRAGSHIRIDLINSVDILKPTIKVDANGAGDTLDAQIAAVAVMIALLMLNVKGIEKRVVETESLNKQRVKRNKHPVPSHTVIHIGTIYDRSGKGHRYINDGKRGPMPVHMRRGHARHQACGEGMKDHKWVYIPPVLVNYREESTMRIPEQTVRI